MHSPLMGWETGVHMNARALVLVVAVAVSACGGSDPAPTAPTTPIPTPAPTPTPMPTPTPIPRVTDYFTARITVAGPDGTVTLDSDVPKVRIGQTGPVDATCTFVSPVPCDFVLWFSADGRSSALSSQRGPGPTLTASGTVAAGEYSIYLSARSYGASLCSGAGSGTFTYAVTVTHP